jgi:hypothetical protein
MARGENVHLRLPLVRLTKATLLPTLLTPLPRLDRLLEAPAGPPTARRSVHERIVIKLHHPSPFLPRRKLLPRSVPFTTLLHQAIPPRSAVVALLLPSLASLLASLVRVRRSLSLGRRIASVPLHLQPFNRRRWRHRRTELRTARGGVGGTGSGAGFVRADFASAVDGLADRGGGVEFRLGRFREVPAVGGGDGGGEGGRGDAGVVVICVQTLRMSSCDGEGKKGREAKEEKTNRKDDPCSTRGRTS